MDANSWAGFQPSYHLMKKGDVMFTPLGHMVIERSFSGTMVYGSRKSYILSGNASMAEYGQCLDLFSKSGNNSERMQQVQECLKQATAKLKQS